MVEANLVGGEDFQGFHSSLRITLGGSHVAACYLYSIRVFDIDGRFARTIGLRFRPVEGME